MDNMITHEDFIKRNFHHSSDNDKSTKSLLTDRTTHLLQEAERMLAFEKNLKEKEWMEGFIQKLQILASVLKQNVTNQNSENESKSLTIKEIAQSLNSSTHPENHLQQQTSFDLISTAVPESWPEQQSNQMTSKHLSVTLPDFNQVKPINDYSREHQVVTKPGLVNAEVTESDDELVQELENLHTTSSLYHTQQRFESPKSSSRILATPMTSIEQSTGKKDEIEIEKEKIREHLAIEVEKLRNLGETEDEIAKTLHIHEFKLVDSKEPQIENNKEHLKKFDEKNESLSNHDSVKRVLDVKHDETVISKVNPNYWTIPALHTAELPSQIYMNNSILGMHISLPLMNPRVLRRQFHYGLHRNQGARNLPFYHADLKNTIQKLQDQNHQNFMLRNHMFGPPNILHLRPSSQSVRVGPDDIAYSNSRYPPDNPAAHRYIKPAFIPYPQNYNTEHKNDGSNFTQSKITTFATSSLPSEFSDEIKRQLRDGKVILLSDSVVRSNFTSDSETIENHKADDSKKEMQ